VVLLRHFDLVVLAAALPVFIGADLPLVAYATVAIAWVAERGVQFALTRRAHAAADARRQAAMVLAAMFSRPFVLVVAIVAAGIVERKAGLAAAVLAAVLFTVYFAITLINGALGTPRRPSS
jgi:hypothetical protein